MARHLDWDRHAADKRMERSRAEDRGKTLVSRRPVILRAGLGRRQFGDCAGCGGCTWFDNRPGKRMGWRSANSPDGVCAFCRRGVWK